MRPYHKTSEHLRQMVNRATNDGNVTTYELNKINTYIVKIKDASVKWKIDGELRLAEVNEFGRAYQCMGQGSMAYSLIVTYEKLADFGVDTSKYLKFGYAVADVLLDDWKNGGLSSFGSDGGRWFHGQTSKTLDRPGGTLNKHMDAVGHLFEIADSVDSFDFKKADEYRVAAKEGFMQFLGEGFDKTGLPSMIDFVNGGDHWMFYKWNFDKDKPAYMHAEWKLANYHSLVMNQTYFAFTELGIDPTGYRSILAKMLEPYELKLEEGLYTGDKEGFHGFSHKHGHPLSDTVLDWYREIVHHGFDM